MNRGLIIFMISSFICLLTLLGASIANKYAHIFDLSIIKNMESTF